jgi:glyoxalase family protein
MLTDTPGIHHVTAMVGDAGANARFYGEALGLRMLRRTVNFEDVLQHHLYFGDATGSVGSVFTVFPDPHADPGRVGKPGYEAAAFAVPPGSIEFWRDRLAARDIAVERRERFGDDLLRLADPSGTTVELVASSVDGDPWAGGPVPATHAIRSLYGTTALPTDPYGAASVLETLGFEYQGETDERVRYRAPGDRARVIDLLDRDASYIREGPGVVHHTAVRVPDREALREWHDLFRDRNYTVSRIKDRHFFHSLYVRGPGGVLVELATEERPPDGPPGPGLADSGTEGHARDLYLPERFEADREMIEGQLPALDLGGES